MTATEVDVKLVGTLRGFAGKSRFTIGLEKPATVATLVQKLAASFGSEFKRALIDPELNDPRPRALILVNGREIGLLQELGTKLGDGDAVTIIPVSHGG